MNVYLQKAQESDREIMSTNKERVKSHM